MNTPFYYVLQAALILAVAVAIFVLAKRGRDRKDIHYDEMQLVIRGTGYRIGFFVTVIGLFIVSFLFDYSDSLSRLVSPTFCMMAVALAGIVTVYCVFKDAFYSIGQNRKGYIILCILAVISNAVGFSGHVLGGTLFDTGALTFSEGGTLICAVSFLVILIALAIKEIMDKKEVAE